MSQKHLTESGWKSIAAKASIKDNGLLKALHDLEGASKPDEKLTAAAKVEKLATEQQKSGKGAKEVTDYLAEVISEVGKTRKAAEALKKEEEAKESETDEEAGNPEALKKKLLAALSQVKSRSTEEPPLEFLTASAGSEARVIVAASAGTKKKLLTGLLPGGGVGAKFVAGTCIWEENAYTFVVERVPSGLAKAVKKALLDETGQSLRVRVRSADGAQVADSETDSDALHDDIDIGEHHPTTSEEHANFLTRFKQLKPDLDRVIAGNTSVSGEVKTHGGQVATLARGQQYAEALELLPALEELVHKGLAELKPAEPTEAEFKERLAGLMPSIKEAMARGDMAGLEIKTHSGEAAGFARGHDYVRAMAALDSVEKLLKSDSSKSISVMALGKARLEWKAAREKAMQDLDLLKKAIAEKFKGREEMQSALTTANGKLDGIFKTIGGELGEQLDAILNEANPEKRISLASSARGTLQGVASYLGTDPILAELDGNEVLPETAITEPLKQRLEAIRAALGNN